MKVSLLFLIPLITGILCLLTRQKLLIGRIQTIGMFFLFGIGLIIIGDVLKIGSIHAFGDFIYIDALSGLMIFIITSVSLLASLYSIGYMVNEVEERIQGLWKLKGYYFLLNVFICTMLAVVTTNSLGIIWISIELTTLVSAFLVGYYNRETPVEAAWKYIILCTVGITFAMIGIVLSYYAVTHVGGLKEQGLNFDYLITIAHKLDPDLMKAAFVFILIGYGTKAGLAPMHSWLPDAHSEAPTPVSALLSGVLLKCAIYGIIRFTILTNLAVGKGFSSELLLFFGLFSIAIATPFILVQKNIKRLLAYSSLEHVGIITTGLAFGTPIAVFGALIHMINHAMVKSLMFFTSGNLALKFHSKDMDHMKGAIQLMPVSGVVLLIGGLALAGSPPFSVFISEFYILSGGVQGHHWIASGIFVTLLTIIFGGLIYNFIQVSMGPLLESTGAHLPQQGEINRSSTTALLAPLLMVCVLGIYIPGPMVNLINESVKILNMGHAL